MNDLHDTEVLILRLGLRAMTHEFDKFISECQDDNGMPKAPSRQALDRARKYLPEWCFNAQERKHDQ